MRNKFVVYTAIANNYDFPRAIPNSLSGIEFICFTDEDSRDTAKQKGWRVRPLPRISDDPTRCCREVKLKPHLYLPEYNYSLWIDANIQMYDCVIDDLFILLSNSVEIASFKHPVRDCVYEEAKACIELGKDRPEIIQQQVSFLKEISYPSNSGLCETNVLFRQHNLARVIRVMNSWAEILEKFSKRDQLGFGYALWICGAKHELINGNARGDNPGFELGPHRRGERDWVAFIQSNFYSNHIYKYAFSLLSFLRKILYKFRLWFD